MRTLVATAAFYALYAALRAINALDSYWKKQP